MGELTWGKGKQEFPQKENFSHLEKFVGFHFCFPSMFSPTFFPHIFPHVKTRRCRPIIIIIFFLYFLIKKERKKFCKAAAAEGVYGGNIWGKPLHLSRFTFINLPWSFVKSI